MKIILLQGDDVQKVEERFSSLVEHAKNKDYKICNLDYTQTDLAREIRKKDLFQEKRFIEVSKFSYLRKEDIDSLLENAEDPDIVVCIKSDSIVAASKLKKIQKYIKIETFTLPKILWTFLDNLKSGNCKKSLELFAKTLETQPVELVFFLLSQRFITLYWAKTQPSLIKSASWQVVKLQNQAEEFSQEKLSGIINQLAEIDYKVKTGKDNLRSSLDFFIASNLE